MTWSVVGTHADDVCVVELNAAGAEVSRRSIAAAALASAIAEAPADRRWVWSDTTRWYPALLAAGVTVARCHDLRLCHAILRDSVRVRRDAGLRAATRWDGPAGGELPERSAPTLFELPDASPARGIPAGIDDTLAEFARQRAAAAEADEPDKLRLLLAAESAGALLACEMHEAGLPWSRRAHERILEEQLGPRPPAGGTPDRVAELAARVRALLGDDSVHLESQPKLLRALHRVGVSAKTTSRWELAEYDHPVVAPLLAYKKLTRLASANGWAWLDEWAADGRFRPVYVPGGVVTGRWASSGGGALQLPRMLRPAVRADPGWTLVVADVAQLEPRVLAALAADTALAAAARGTDLYAGLVAGGVVSTRAEAKVALLGAMYGATTGDSARMLPALRRAYPRAMRLVDDAASTGEQGGIVSTLLGRSSPGPSEGWHALQRSASDAEASPAAQSQARRSARDRGRFTRNFVVQGTAAEWALAWLADLRGRLAALPPMQGAPAAASGPVFSRRAHLAFFLHDEIIVHAPVEQADQAAAAVQAAAETATRLLFGRFPLDFALDLRITADAAKT